MTERSEELLRTVEALLQEALRMSPPYDTMTKEYVRKALAALAALASEPTEDKLTAQAERDVETMERLLAKKDKGR